MPKFDQTAGRSGILALHGFLGRGLDLGLLSAGFNTETVFSPDLFQEAAQPCFETVVDQLLAEAALITKQTAGLQGIVGYSLGARLAVLLVDKLERRPAFLIVESPHPGFSNVEQAGVRALSDQKLSKKLQRDFNSFLEVWYQNPIFSNLPRELLVAQASKLNKSIMAAVLSELSPGVMPNLRPVLAQLQIPTLVINGGDDLKFTEYGRELADLGQHINQTIVPGVGHNIHLENPEAYLAAIKAFRVNL